MLPQTNLQLYRAMIDASWRSPDLARARAAYDIARELFAGAYRPSHKPFICHLVGTAGALVAWQAKPDIVLAGLLHSAYLYGDFADGERGPSPRRRAYVRDRVGAGAERLVYDYSHTRRDAFSADGDAALIRLADRLDEWIDGGPKFAIGKPIDSNTAANQLVAETLEAADRLVGAIAVRMFDEAIAVCDTLAPEACLTTPDRSFHVLRPGAAELRRPPLMRRVVRLSNKIHRKLAA